MFHSMVSVAFWIGKVGHGSCGATQDPQTGVVCHEPVCHRVPFDGSVPFAYMCVRAQA